MNETDLPSDSTKATETGGISRRRLISTGALSLAGLALSNAFAQTGGRPPGAPTPIPGNVRANPQGRFAGRVVIVTGATSGIGRRTAERFALEGAKVMFNGRREQLGREVEAMIRAHGGEATYLRTDVRDDAQVKAFVDACVQKYGTVHIAFNNAGIDTRQAGPLAEQPLEDLMNCLLTNTVGVFSSMRYELPVMLRNEPWGAYGTRGVIVNNASTSGLMGFANIGPYSISKHGQVGITRGAAVEYGRQGIRINAIAPGGVDTPMRARAYARQIQAGQPLPTPGNIADRANTTDEMADVVMFLAENASSSILGTVVDVTTGQLGVWRPDNAPGPRTNG